MINETNPELIKAMKIAFATEYSFYLKAHFYHWNVEGADFSQYHKLFGKIYKEVYGSIDPFAENIRKLGSYTPGSYTRFSMLSQIDDELTVQPAMDMIRELLDDGEKILKVLDMVYDLAEGARQFGISNFLAERIDAHQKHNWMLRATLS
jgi:starvation-inducible DNA-binding protein